MEDCKGFYDDGAVENGGFVGLNINGVDGRKVKVEEEQRK